MYSWIHGKYSSTSLSSVYGREKLSWYDKINIANHVCHCGAVVKELLERADKLGSTPGNAVFCFFVPFFFSVWSLFFLTLFSLLICTLPKLTTRKKKHKLSRHVPPLKQVNFVFNLSWHHDKQHTVHHKITGVYPILQCHCLRKCSRGQKLWSTDLAETWHRSWVWWDISKATLARLSDF